MQWYYVFNGQQTGPVDDAQFRELVQTGAIRGDTLVWREGMPEWLPYQKVYETSSGAAPSAEGTQYQPRPGTRFGDVIASGPQTADAESLVADVQARDYSIDIGHCISRAWELVKSNFWLTVGATLLINICAQAAGIIPLLGIILSLILTGPLMAGLCLMFLKLMRGQPATLGDAFSGFGPRFWPTCGTFVLLCLAVYLPLFPMIGLLIVMASQNTEPGVLFFVLLVLGMIGMIYFLVSFAFAIPLAIDRNLSPTKALGASFRVVKMHWWSIFGLAFVASLLNILGLLVCIVGVFVTTAIFYVALLYAYEDIFGRR